MAVDGKQAGAGRYAWLDHARGIGILLVVYGHQMRAQATSGHMPGSWHGPLQDALIYSFHMPLFFFISGLVSYRSLRDKPVDASIRDKLSTIAYPYVLWSIISWCLSALAVHYVNQPMDLKSLLSIAYQPILQYWFLYVLFFCQMVALIFRRMLLVSVLLAAILLVAPLPFVSVTVFQFVTSFPFFAIGLMLSGAMLAPRPDLRPWEIAVALASLIVFVGLACLPPERSVSAALVLRGQTWTGIAFVISVSRLIGTRWSWLSSLGRGSMAIFVMHSIVAAGIRTLLVICGIHDPVLMLAACVTGAVAVPLLIARLATYYGLTAALGLGKSDRSARREPAISASS